MEFTHTTPQEPPKPLVLIPTEQVGLDSQLDEEGRWIGSDEDLMEYLCYLDRVREFELSQSEAARHVLARTGCAISDWDTNESEEIHVDWNEEKKEFQVSLLLQPDQHQEIVRRLTLEVANESTCSCGATLLLKDYSIRRNGDDFAFTGTYRCSSCKRGTVSWFHHLGAFIEALWKNTTKIEIAPIGLKYEKQGLNRE